MTTTFQIGDCTVHRIIEMEFPFGPALDFLPTLTPELLAENRAWLRPWALSDDDKLILCIQSYVIKTPHHTVLIDSCVGNDKDRPARPFWHRKTDPSYLASLAAHGLRPEDIDVVMCTHLHVDHVGWNTKLENGRWVPTFPNARYVFGKEELTFWLAENEKTLVPAIADSVVPILDANRADIVDIGHVVGDHIRLLPTPGHTKGHFAVTLGKTREEAVFTGDLIHTPLQARYPELAMRVDYDPVQSIATRRMFFERYCDTPTVCCTAHFPSPSRTRVKRWGNGFQCDYVSD